MTHAKNEYNSISARRFIKNFIGRKSNSESRFGATGETMAVPIEFMKGCRHIDWKIYGIELSRDCRRAINSSTRRSSSSTLDASALLVLEKNAIRLVDAKLLSHRVLLPVPARERCMHGTPPRKAVRTAKLRKFRLITARGEEEVRARTRSSAGALLRPSLACDYLAHLGGS
jgi:hypothetical protein